MQGEPGNREVYPAPAVRHGWRLEPAAVAGPSRLACGRGDSGEVVSQHGRRLTPAAAQGLSAEAGEGAVDGWPGGRGPAGETRPEPDRSDHHRGA